MYREIIFIGGIHGVGKTTLCQKIAQKTNIEHYSAGKLINMLKKESANSSRDKRVANVTGNQEVLISAINHFINEGSSCLLDGHFCLLNQDDRVTDVPKAIFEEISPVAIILLYGSIERIAQQIADRDDKSYDGNLLSLFQSRELDYSRDIADALHIPYFAFNVESNSVLELVRFIEELKYKEVQ